MAGKKKDDNSILLLLLLLGGAFLLRGGSAVHFTDPNGNPVSIQPEDGAISRAADGRCYRYWAAENSWYPVDCPMMGL